MPFGTMSGAGVIFGVSGGVTEAVLRRITPPTSPARPLCMTISYTGRARHGGRQGGRRATTRRARGAHIAVVSGLKNASDLIIERLMKAGECQYDFVEVMACPGGCVSRRWAALYDCRG
jgi:NADH-quinone oxidoreductase subunit G